MTKARIAGRGPAGGGPATRDPGYIIPEQLQRERLEANVLILAQRYKLSKVARLMGLPIEQVERIMRDHGLEPGDPQAPKHE